MHLSNGHFNGLRSHVNVYLVNYVVQDNYLTLGVFLINQHG